MGKVISLPTDEIDEYMLSSYHHVFVGIYSPLLTPKSCDSSHDYDSCYLAYVPTLNSGLCTLQLCI